MWVTCNVCSKAIADNGSDSTSDPAPCCGGMGTRTMWPPHSYTGPLGLLKRVDFDTDDGARTGCLFLAALLESLLEEALWNMLQRNVPANVVLAVMDRASGRDKLLGIYKRLVGMSAAQVLEAEGRGTWFEDWQALVQARNDLAHGGWHTTKPLPELVQSVWLGSLSAMACLRNAGVDAMIEQADHVITDEVPDD